MEIVYSGLGWVRVEGIGLPGPLFLQFSGDAVTGVALNGRGAEITAGHLRSIPLAKLAALALRRPDLLFGLGSVPGAPKAPDVFTQLARTTPGRRRHSPRIDTDATLHAPSAGLTADFLQDVAAAYRAALARGERPNKSLARQTGAPQRTVERWVYLARKRGLLPSGRPGRAG